MVKVVLEGGWAICLSVRLFIYFYIKWFVIGLCFNNIT